MNKGWRLSKSVFLVAATAFVLSGCATIIRGTQQNVDLDSVPKGSAVLINGKEVATTPCTVTVRRNHEYILQIKRRGFETKTFLIGNTNSNEASTYKIGSSVNLGYMLGDIGSGLILGTTAAIASEIAATNGNKTSSTVWGILVPFGYAGPAVIDAATGAWAGLDRTNVNIVLHHKGRSH